MNFRALVLLSVLMVLPSVAAAQERDQVLLVLSSRHLVASADQLEKLAGGADPLAKRLVKLRLDQTTPFVGVRAAKLLLKYTNAPDVVQAIEEDIGSEDRDGLARVYAVQIDSVPDGEVRKAIAQKLIERGSKDPSFRPFVRVLGESHDPEVAKICSAALQ